MIAKYYTQALYFHKFKVLHYKAKLNTIHLICTSLQRANIEFYHRILRVSTVPQQTNTYFRVLFLQSI